MPRSGNSGAADVNFGPGREFFGNEFSSYFSIALFALILLYSESLLTGAAPAEGAISNQSWLAGETQKGLHLCGLWPPVWVPASAASDDLKCGESCTSALYPVVWIGLGAVGKRCCWSSGYRPLG